MDVLCQAEMPAAMKAVQNRTGFPTKKGRTLVMEWKRSRAPTFNLHEMMCNRDTLCLSDCRLEKHSSTQGKKYSYRWNVYLVINHSLLIISACTPDQQDKKSTSGPILCYPLLPSKQKASRIKWFSSSCCISCLFTLFFYVILNRQATSLSMNHSILWFFINNHSTHTDIPTKKGKQLKPSEL